MSTLSLPMLSSVGTAHKINKAVFELTSILDQARAEAMATNSYVWIGLEQNETPSASSIIVHTLTARDGINIVSSPAPVKSIPPSAVRYLGKPIKLDQVTIAGELAQFPNHPRPSGNEVLTLGQSSSAPIEWVCPDRTVKFYDLIEISPLGEFEIVASSQNAQVLEIALSPKLGQHVKDKLSAAIQVTSLTGRIKIYRQ